jgi:hypothetical protein
MYRYSLVDASGAHQGATHTEDRCTNLVTPGRPRIDSRQFKAVSADLGECSQMHPDERARRRALHTEVGSPTTVRGVPTGLTVAAAIDGQGAGVRSYEPLPAAV